MPRPKLLYTGQGEWKEVEADYRTCEHPRGYRRFYPDALPMRVYCLLCGAPNLHPLLGMTEEELEKNKRKAHDLWRSLHGYGPEDEPVKVGREWAEEDGVRITGDKRREAEYDERGATIRGKTVFEAFSRPDWEKWLRDEATWERI